MSIENDLNSLILDSAYTADSFVFPQELPINPNPLKLCKWYENEINTISDQLNILEKKHNLDCTCSKGCAACCHQLIVINHLEYRIIEFALNNLPLSDRTKIKDIVIRQCEFLTQHNYSPKTLSSPYISIEKHHDMQQDFFSFNLPCPLSTEDNTCSIYSFRPTVCWSYRNYGNPIQCSQTWDVSTVIKYDDWEAQAEKHFQQIKKPSPRNPIMILQFALFTILTAKKF